MSIRAGVSTSSGLNLPTPRQITLDRKIFADPTDGAGNRLSMFGLGQVYRITSEVRGGVNSLRDKLYSRVFGRISEANISGTTIEFNNYQDFGQARESRLYIVARRNTIRGSNVSIFIRFLNIGENLYVGIDSYVLGMLNWWKIIVKAIPVILFLFSLQNLKPGGAGFLPYYLSPGPVFFYFVSLFWLIVSGLAWQRFIRRSMKNGIEVSLRQEFGGRIDPESFNLDDMIMFIKLSLRLVVTSVSDVFKEEGIDTDALDYFVQNINNISYNTLTASGSGNISVANSVLGMGSSVGGVVGTK